MTVSTFVVLVNGHTAVGKTTLGRQLTPSNGAIWTSRDTVHGPTARILPTRSEKVRGVVNAIPGDSFVGADNPGREEGG